MYVLTHSCIMAILTSMPISAYLKRNFICCYSLYFNFKHITNYTIMNKYVTMQTHSLNLPQLGRRHLKNIQDLLHSFRYIYVSKHGTYICITYTYSLATGICYICRCTETSLLKESQVFSVTFKTRNVSIGHGCPR